MYRVKAGVLIKDDGHSTPQVGNVRIPGGRPGLPAVGASFVVHPSCSPW